VKREKNELLSYLNLIAQNPLNPKDNEYKVNLNFFENGAQVAGITCSQGNEGCTSLTPVNKYRLNLAAQTSGQIKLAAYRGTDTIPLSSKAFWKGFIRKDYITELLRDKLAPYIIKDLIYGPVIYPPSAIDYKITNDAVFMTEKAVPAGTEFVVNNSDTVFYAQSGVKYISEKDPAGNTTVGTVANAPSMNFASAIQSGSAIFSAGNLVVSSSSIVLPMSYTGTASQRENYTMEFSPLFGKIEKSGSSWSYTALAPIPAESILNLRLFEIGGIIRAAVVNGNMLLTVFTYNSSNNSWTQTGSLNQGSFISLASLKVVNNSAYFATTDRTGTDIFVFNPETGVEKYLDLTDAPISNLKIDQIQGGIRITVLDEIRDMKAYNIDIKGASFEMNSIAVMPENFVLKSSEDFCLIEDGGYIAAGKKDGIACIPFDNGTSDEIVIGNVAEVYSVAGYDNIVFAGSLNHIYAIDINHPETPKSSVYAYGPVRSMKLQGRYLYAAVENGIQIIDVSNPLSITTQKIVNYHNYTYGATTDIEFIRYNYFVASDLNGVTLFEVQELSGTVNLINRGEIITVQDQIESIATAESILYTVDSNGLVSKYDISNLLNPLLLGDASIFCESPVLKIVEGETYLACEDNIFKIGEPTNGDLAITMMTGDRTDFTEEYYYKGSYYFADYDSIRVSR